VPRDGTASARRLAAGVLAARSVVLPVVACSSPGGQGGLAAKGSWSKPNLRDATVYIDSKGFPMDFQPGMASIILAPLGTRVSTAEARS
jgi:hypothetical protein